MSNCYQRCNTRLKVDTGYRGCFSLVGVALVGRWGVTVVR